MYTCANLYVCLYWFYAYSHTYNMLIQSHCLYYYLYIHCICLYTPRFNDEVGITGAILTKLDGDTRGGAALSVRGVSGKPIKFIG